MVPHPGEQGRCAVDVGEPAGAHTAGGEREETARVHGAQVGDEYEPLPGVHVRRRAAGLAPRQVKAAERSDSMPFETELTALVFVIRCVELCARRLNVPTDIFLASQLDESSLMGESQKMILRLVGDVLVGQNPGFAVDETSVRRKFVSACCMTLTDLVGITSASGIPAVFTLHDLFVSLQRLDHDDGSLVV